MIASMWVSGCSKMKPQTSKENSVADIVSIGSHDYIKIPIKDLAKGKISKIMLGDKLNLLSKLIIDGCDPAEANGCERIASNNGNGPEDPTEGGTAMAKPKYDPESPEGGGDPLITVGGEQFALLKIRNDKAPKEYQDAIAFAKGEVSPSTGCNEPDCGAVDPKLKLDLYYSRDASALGLADSDKKVEIIKVEASLSQKK